MMPPAKSKLAKLSTWSTRIAIGVTPARRSDQIDLSPLVPDNDADADTAPTSTSPSPTSAAGTWRVFSLLTARIVVSRESTRRLLIESFAGALVAVFAILLLALLLSRVTAARHFDSSLMIQSPSYKTNGAKLRAVELAKKVQMLNKSCERHCARTRREFGCVLIKTPAIGAFVSRPSDDELIAIGCRCLNAELLCDQRYHCRNGTDEWPDTCSQWNATTKCRSADFICATGLATDPKPGRRPFCIPKTAHCDRHADCDDRSDELNCPQTITSVCRDSRKSARSPSIDTLHRDLWNKWPSQSPHAQIIHRLNPFD